jgi:phosphoenolpyruvate phosphomutase
MDEFCGKIKAAKDVQHDPDFCVVARTESFIAGWGLEEALKRADAYYRAGADAILVHSKISTADQVLAFMAEWRNDCPIVVVPTTYYSVPTDSLADAGISLAIWANHLLRASITAMQETAAILHREQRLLPIEDEIASVKEIFRLQNAAELKVAERQYLPK